MSTDTAPLPLDAAGHPGAAICVRVGAIFEFRGLPGQVREATPMPGSGSVGSLLQINAVAPWGTVAVRCAETEEGLGDGVVVSIGFADAMAMIAAGVWTPHVTS